MSNKDHDRFVRRNFANLKLARRFLQHFLPTSLQDRIDLDQLRLEKDTYLDESLKEVITDMLYAAPTKEDDGFICVLMEHKSEGALRAAGTNLPFQLHYQEMKILNHYRKNDPAYMMPPVLLLGLYHGSQPYSGPRTLAEKIRAPQALIPRRWKEHILLIDLFECEEDRLDVGGQLGYVLRLLKHIYDDDIVEYLKSISAGLHELEMEDPMFLVSMFRYLYEVSKEKNREKFEEIALQSLSEEKGGLILTIAEQLRKEGESIGLQEGERIGLQKGQQQLKTAVLSMVQNGFDAQTIAEYTSLPIEDVLRFISDSEQ